jgi:hypothetical protein
VWCGVVRRGVVWFGVEWCGVVGGWGGSTAHAARRSLPNIKVGWEKRECKVWCSVLASPNGRFARGGERLNSTKWLHLTQLRLLSAQCTQAWKAWGGGCSASSLVGSPTTFPSMPLPIFRRTMSLILSGHPYLCTGRGETQLLGVAAWDVAVW